VSDEKPADDGVGNALARAVGALKEAATALELAPQYHPQVGWTTGYRQSIRAMISSIEYLAKEIGK
jgi:hypothetical protein